jgi:hypothetical protein
MNMGAMSAAVMLAALGAGIESFHGCGSGLGPNSFKGGVPAGPVPENPPLQIGRNDCCPCGSRKKFKRCVAAGHEFS